MEEQERTRILELAFQMVELQSPHKTGNLTEAAITEWHKLFDKTCKAITKTAME